MRGSPLGRMPGLVVLALVLFAGIRERLETSKVPDAFRGAASALVVAGILSLAFMGFAGLIKV